MWQDPIRPISRRVCNLCLSLQDARGPRGGIKRGASSGGKGTFCSALKDAPQTSNVIFLLNTWNEGGGPCVSSSPKKKIKSWSSSQALLLSQLYLLDNEFCMFPAERFFQKLDPPSLSSHTEVRVCPPLWSGFIGRKITKKGEKGCYQPSHLMGAGKWNEGGRNFFVPGFLIQSFLARGWNEFLFSKPFQAGLLQQRERTMRIIWLFGENTLKRGEALTLTSYGDLVLPNWTGFVLRCRKGAGLWKAE